MIESWKYCQQKKGLLIHAYVIVTNHVHMIISRNLNSLLKDIMRDMKKFTAAKILEAIKTETESRKEWMLTIFQEAGESNSNNTVYQFWQQDTHDIFQQKMEYLPVRQVFMKIL